MSDEIKNKQTWLVNYTGKKGGGPLDAISMTRALIQNGENVAAVVSADVENLAEWKKLDLIKLVVIQTYKNKKELMINSILFPFRQGRQIKAEFKEISIDVIYCPMITFWTGRINRIFRGSRKLEVLHDPIPHSGENRIISGSVHREVKNADIIAVHSEKFVDYVRTKYGKTTIWFPLGRHSEYSQIEKRDKGFDFDGDRINFLFFGTLSKYKGLDILAKAYIDVEQTLGKGACTLYIVGSGDFSSYQNSYDGIETCRVINEWIPNEEVESYFMGENLIFVCPYVDGTQSGAVMLALEYQIPIIATNVGGISEQIEDGKTGILVKPGDVRELYNAMLLLAKDKEKRKSIIKNQKNSLQRFDWYHSARILIEAVSCRS